MILLSSMKILSVFFFLLFILISTLTHADERGTSEDTTSEDFDAPICNVTHKDGSDLMEDLYVTTFDVSGNGDAYVNCTGTKVCEGAIIEGCSDVRCSGEEACLRAQITNATESVLCEGVHACHYANISMTNTSLTVTCSGGESCDNANITGYKGEGDVLPSLELDCDGAKACRNVTAEWMGLVKCHGGTATEPACKDLATFANISCIYCGTNGCADHINMCRYKLVEPSDYQACQPLSIVGANDERLCPHMSDLEQELNLEMEGGEEPEEGTEE